MDMHLRSSLLSIDMYMNTALLLLKGVNLEEEICRCSSARDTSISLRFTGMVSSNHTRWMVPIVQTETLS